ncbi:protein-disulfide reductase DsbD [Vibrio rumoiensis]|uniref:Thiol:disulfide interchange protein DsbD n=1 Tax=Vibrio rumoiensis 1S-45 TaxID=1188252 RepID=A0A1E5E5V8_9VIBR|nr:protein-disulfide reductase DsbD [Vibrio rumoiensis]OEF29412.1 protein-disulfide reductase DsbD [Vibrio rumoiensis 1S-45]
MLRARSVLIVLLGLFVSFSSLAVNFDSTNGPLQAFQNAPSANNTPKFVPVDQAFPFNFYQQGSSVHLDWQVKDGYYLYKERFSFQGKGATLGDAVIPDGTFHTDEFFGDVYIFTDPVSIEIPLRSVAENGELIVQYQGCATSGFCYPPETRVIPLDSIGSSQNQTATPSASANTQTANASQATSTNAQTSTVSSGSADANIASELAEYWWTPFLFLALGIGLAFTPCVLPMYPILTGIVLGGGRLPARKAFKLSFVYVQGMALTYMLLGLVVASLGVQFQAALQAPAVLIGLSVLFVLLSLSMFGVYNIQLPSRLQTWLNEQSNKQQGGNLVGVFVMGVISGLVCSPCTTAPLSGALLYVAQSGDLLTGAIALYALAIGMGIPLILVAVFGNKLLPQAGEWMNRVKVLFGFILLAAPIFLLERILPVTWVHGLWVVLGLAAFGWLYHVKQNMSGGNWKQSLVGIIATLGLVYSSYFGLQSLGLISTHSQAQQQQQTQIGFTRIKTVAELEQQLAQAKQAGKPVMFDYYADWCVACKEFEKYTFHDPKVSKQLEKFVLLQADVTAANPDDIALMQKMKVLGLPTIEFWDADGNHVPKARVTGFVKAEPFFNHLLVNKLITPEI